MAINFKEVGFTYQLGTPFATPGLHDVNFTIAEHSFTAVIGHTGSGKSTMVQHLDGLLIPTSGVIEHGEVTIEPDMRPRDLNQMRAHVGLAFQFPEAQLFEQTVLKDVMFGPKNFGKTEVEARDAAVKALRLVGMAAEFDERTPFDLSGGQMRRVALAGVLAMEPDLLILDEPTAGLDPAGQTELMNLFATLQREQALTIVLITHQMEYVAEYADQVIVFEGATGVRQGTPQEVFADADWLHERQLDVPLARQFADQLAQKGIVLEHVLDMNQLADQLAERLGGGRHV
jgi:energy-coupling factor transport system ATP-binding protein